LIFSVLPGFSVLPASNSAAATATPVVAPLADAVRKPAPRMVMADAPMVNSAGALLLLTVCADDAPLLTHATRVACV